MSKIKEIRFELEESVHAQFKVACVLMSQSMRDVLRNFVINTIANKINPNICQDIIEEEDAESRKQNEL